LKAELEKVATDLRDRVVFGVQVPATAHSALIGRGARNLISFQNKYNVQVQYPGSNSYKFTGEPENAEELGDVAPEDLVKVMGPKAAVEEAIAQLNVRFPVVVNVKRVFMPLQSQVDNATPSESITDAITVPLKYHDAVTRQGTIFRTLRANHGVEAEPSAQPTRPALPSRPLSSMASAARVDDVEDVVTEARWEVVENYTDAEEGDSTWTLKGRDQASIDSAKSTITEAIDKAQAQTHVGFLTLPDRSSFPRIVGTKGSNIARLHDMTGANIHVGRDNNTIVITGSFAISLTPKPISHLYRPRVLAGSRKGSHFENYPWPHAPETGPLKVIRA
jgi:KH domain